MKHILLLFLSAAASAQMNTNPGNMGPPKKIKEIKPAQTPPPKRRTDTIEGQCVILAGGGNLMPSPCPEVVLTLQGKGEPIQTRTDREGMFEFVTEQGQQYKVASGSKFYEVVEPLRPVFSGSRLEIHLKQKN